MNLTQTAYPLRFAHSRRTDEFKASALPHMNDIYRTAVRMLGNGSAADDVLQDVYFAGMEIVPPIRVGNKLPCLAV